MISSSNVEKHNAVQWFQAQMLKNTRFFNDFKLKCLKTQCVSMISSSNGEKHNAFQWFQAQMLKTHNAFQWFQGKMLKKTQCFSMISSSNV